MWFDIPPQLIALAAALSYAASGIAAKRGLRYSTPITVTLVSVTIHAITLSAAVLLTGGIPAVSWWVLFLFAVTGTLQPIIRLFTYAGIHYIGASRGTTLREEAIRSGLVTGAQFDRLVRPERMTRPG